MPYATRANKSSTFQTGAALYWRQSGRGRHPGATEAPRETKDREGRANPQQETAQVRQDRQRGLGQYWLRQLSHVHGVHGRLRHGGSETDQQRPERRH